MAKCAACGRFIPSKGGATCSILSCSSRYHFACLLLPETTQMSSTWKCPDCKRTLPRGDNSATPIKDVSGEPSDAAPILHDSKISVSSLEDTTLSEKMGASTPSESPPTLREEIRLFRGELKAVREEMRDFRRAMADLQSAFGLCTQRLDDLETRVSDLESRPSVASSDNTVIQLQNTVARLQLELNGRDQELLSSDLEIANIPEIPGENVCHTVELVASKLGVSLEERDIVFAQRIGARVVEEPAGQQGEARAPRSRRIVVRLARRALRDRLVQNARVRRGATTAELGLSAPPRRFYINERLTRTNKQLFYRVRECGSRHGWKYTWTKSGRILAKQGDGKPTYSIRSEEDLIRVFSGEEATVKNT